MIIRLNLLNTSSIGSFRQIRSSGLLNIGDDSGFAGDLHIEVLRQLEDHIIEGVGEEKIQRDDLEFTLRMIIQGHAAKIFKHYGDLDAKHSDKIKKEHGMSINQQGILYTYTRPTLEHAINTYGLTPSMVNTMKLVTFCERFGNTDVIRIGVEFNLLKPLTMQTLDGASVTVTDLRVEMDVMTKKITAYGALYRINNSTGMREPYRTRTGLRSHLYEIK